MVEDFLVKLFQHNNWANQKIIEACSALGDEQLDAEPRSVTKGAIRRTLIHLVSSQYSYLRTLTLPLEERQETVNVDFRDLQESARSSGESLLALARGEKSPFSSPLKTRDGYHAESWVLMVQVINHAHEHREQICSMLTDLGITPPDMDSWSFGEATNALVPISKQDAK